MEAEEEMRRVSRYQKFIASPAIHTIHQTRGFLLLVFTTDCFTRVADLNRIYERVNVTKCRTAHKPAQSFQVDHLHQQSPSRRSHSTQILMSARQYNLTHATRFTKSHLPPTLTKTTPEINH